MNISKAKQVYKESKDSRNLLLSIFTKEELGVRTIPSKEEFNKFFEEEILSQVDPSKTRFPIENSFSCIHLCNSRGEWLFDYDTDPKNSYFYYQFKCVYAIIMNKFSLQDDELQALMKSLVESHFNLRRCQSLREYPPPVTMVESHFNLRRCQSDGWWYTLDAEVDPHFNLRGRQPLSLN